MARRKSPKKVEPELTPRVDGVTWGSPDELRSIDWFWPGALPAGVLCLLEGRKSTGKSSLAAAIAAAVTGGPPLPGWTGPTAARVLWQASEDDWNSVVIPRLIAAGAIVERVGRLDVDAGFGRRRRLQLPDDGTILSDALRETSTSLLVLDPYVSLAGAGLDVRIEQQARAYLEPLAETCAALGVCGLLTRHLRKGSGGDAREAGLGSVAVANVARAILRCDEHPHEPDLFTLAVVAVNHGRRAPTRVYAIEPGSAEYPRITWRGEVALTADAIAEGRGSEADRDEWQEADRLLYTLLSTGWVQVCTVSAFAERAGVTPRMLRRAKARLRIPSRLVGYGPDGAWQWGPPADGWPPGLTQMEGASGARVQEGAPLAPLEKSSEKPQIPPQRKRQRRPGTRVPPPANPIPKEEVSQNGETTT